MLPPPSVPPSPGALPVGLGSFCHHCTREETEAPRLPDFLLWPLWIPRTSLPDHWASDSGGFRARLCTRCNIFPLSLGFLDYTGVGDKYLAGGGQGRRRGQVQPAHDMGPGAPNTLSESALSPSLLTSSPLSWQRVPLFLRLGSSKPRFLRLCSL